MVHSRHRRITLNLLKKRKEKKNHFNVYQSIQKVHDNLILINMVMILKRDVADPKNL